MNKIRLFHFQIWLDRSMANDQFMGALFNTVLSKEDVNLMLFSDGQEDEFYAYWTVGRARLVCKKLRENQVNFRCNNISLSVIKGVVSDHSEILKPIKLLSYETCTKYSAN